MYSTQTLSELLIPPTVTPLYNVTMIEGDDAVFEVIVGGKPEPKVQWFFHFLQVISSDAVITRNAGPLHQLILRRCHPNQSGIVQVKATNNIGSVTSKAHLMVKGKLHKNNNSNLSM